MNSLPSATILLSSKLGLVSVSAASIHQLTQHSCLWLLDTRFEVKILQKVQEVSDFFLAAIYVAAKNLR